MSISSDNQVLVFPRAIFSDAFSLLFWETVQDQVEAIESTFSWLDRPEAERSNDWVQAIPCALIRDDDGKCCVLRRISDEARDDLKGKLSLIVGGHIDEQHGSESFRVNVIINLIRELEEEVGILTDENPRPIGVIIDASSNAASRHVAFIHETTANHVSLSAPEEFMLRSKYSGVFMDEAELAAKIDDFDPWSRLLIEDYVCRDELAPRPRQRSFV